MKTNDKVKWKDLISGRYRYGRLKDREMVVMESQKLKDIYDEPKFKEVNKWTWTVIENHTGHRIALDEDQIEIIKLN